MPPSPGALQFPTITVNGGTLFGAPVTASDNAPSLIALLDPPTILYADGGISDLRFAKSASILMDSDPQSSPQTTSVRSLWQRGEVGVICERFLGSTGNFGIFSPSRRNASAFGKKYSGQRHNRRGCGSRCRSGNRNRRDRASTSENWRH